MDDLRGRFRRLDRVPAPDLWNEAVARAAELDLGRRRTFNPGMALIAAALLLAALAGTLAVGAWLTRPSPVSEAVTYENGLITAYHGCGVVGIDPGSFETRQLVPPAGACDPFEMSPSRPAWSLDGGRLAYAAPTGRDDAAVGVWLYDAPTGDTRLLDTCSYTCQELDISPDGSLVAYVVEGDGPPARTLYIIHVDSGKKAGVDFIAGETRRPRFSPDGNRVAIALVGGRSGIHVIDVSRVADGSVGHPIMVGEVVDADDLAWSPDGEWIAFRQGGGLGFDRDRQPSVAGVNPSGNGIVITRANGSETRVLAAAPSHEIIGAPTWSPDSATVAYVADHGTADRYTPAVWTAAIDGGEPTPIYESECCDDWVGAPAWSPDGEWIALQVQNGAPDRDSGLILLRPDGSDVRTASELPLEPVWQPIPNE